jgi:hypothetical protein
MGSHICHLSMGLNNIQLHSQGQWSNPWEAFCGVLTAGGKG